MSTFHDQAYENMRDLDALASRERHDAQFGDAEDPDAPDLQHLLEEMRGVEIDGRRFYSCPLCDRLSEQPGKCWRCYL